MTTRRLSVWQGLSRGEIAFTAVSFALIGGAAWWMLGHHKSVAGTILFGIGFVIGLVGLFLAPSYTRRIVIEGPCPKCGSVAIRRFQKRGSRHGSMFPEPCGSCTAELRFDGVRIVEATAADD